MKEKWMANRIGLIDFWYYDDQEFSFVNGRMLLRGANGSGKSVTMQSVVPLLLDGNMRPERLDPFGTRDRKMSGYLLEEGDGREERTGYLYMEFLKKDSGLYSTIGMGIRARKGKPVDAWYFCITDGRRINRDFYLYKENDEKVTLTLRELTNRIGTGGRVMNSQQEYMEYVNQQFFGFETVEEYKEMIDLLIQLRTPKLSKDFKPTVINEILSDSLQPLSEDDLRPMSEAIENMDTLSTNLANKKSSAEAAEKIHRLYERYNYVILSEKAEAYSQSVKDAQKLKREMEQNQKSFLEYDERVREEQEKKLQLDQEKKVLEQERDNLNASDAVGLKNREASVREALAETDRDRQEKERQLAGKEERWKEFQSRFREASQREEILSEQLTTSVRGMGEMLETVYVDEHAFFEKEFLEQIREEFSFETSFVQIRRLSEQLEAGCGILKEMEQHKSEREQLLMDYDSEKRTRSAMERQIAEATKALEELIGEQKEAIYNWNRSNEELKLKGEQLQEINRFLEQFDQHSDYFVIKKDIVSCAYLEAKGLLAQQNHSLDVVENQQRAQLSELEAQLEEWRNQKDPEPEVAPAVQKNRECLLSRGIPFHRFYETVEFEEGMDEKQVDRLEEALGEMGLLDALIVDASYREQIRTLDPGCCDKYIFTDAPYQGSNISELLSVGEDYNDLFKSPQILSVLGGIGRTEDSGTFIQNDGTYGIGVINGTVSGEYKAKYIGKAARARFRESQIHLLEGQIAELTEALIKTEEEIRVLQLREKKLSSEYEAMPDGSALHDKTVELEQMGNRLKEQTAKINALTEQLARKTEQIKSLLEQAQEIAEKVYLDCRYDLFQKGCREIRDYMDALQNLKAEHAKYLQVLGEIRSAKEQMEDTDADLDDIRYELSAIRQRQTRSQMELQSVLDQLKMTGYEQVKEKLDACLKRLEAIPAEVEHSIKAAADYENQRARCQEFLEKAKPESERLDGKKELLKQNLKKELALGYTSYAQLAEENGEDWEKRIEQMLSAVSQSHTTGADEKDKLIENLNQTFYANRGYLLDFNPNLDRIFVEDTDARYPEIHPARIEIAARYRGERVVLGKLLDYLREEIEEIQNLIKAGDKELFEDILANTIGRKIRSKINASMAWVEHMNQLMESMNTSSGLTLSLRWRSKNAEQEEQLDTRELVELLKKDAKLMTEAEFEKLSMHFRSKVEQARRSSKENVQPLSFFAIMRDTLDYRKWFEFQLFFQKSGEPKRELTNSYFGTFSGGEKAMSMYVPLFSAVVAKYQGGREDAPRIVSLDEAFAGVDNRNIRDMFRLMSEFEFNFIINSQVLWGDCDTLDGLAIYQLHRPNNQKFVVVMAFVWNGSERKSVEEIRN